MRDGERDNRHWCQKCGGAMIRGTGYDPERITPLVVGEREENEIWICVNRECEDGIKNLDFTLVAP